MLLKVKKFFLGKIQSSIRYKLFFVYITVISIPIIIFGIISYYMVSFSVKNDFIHYKESLNIQIINNIEQNIHNLDQQSSSAYMMLSDMNLVLDNTIPPTSEEYYDANKRVTDYFIGLVTENDMINGVALIQMDGNVKVSYDRNQTATQSFAAQNLRWFKDTVILHGYPYLREPHLNEFYDNSLSNVTKTSVISICRSVTKAGVTNGVLVVDESTNNFIKTSLNVDTEPGETFILYGKSGNVIYSNSKLSNKQYSSLWLYSKRQSQGTLTYNLNKQEMIANFSSSKDLGWKIISLLPESQIQKKVQFLNNINIILITISIVLIIIISIFVSNFITLPLNRLINSFKKLQNGDFTVNVEVKGKDELSQIGLTFNRMVIEIRNLIDQKYELGILKKQAELDSLQSQINPHFLFNTLSSIREVVINEDNEKSAIMLQSLSDIFRYNLNKGHYEVKFYEELDYLKKYLFIQKCRFGDKYDIIYDIDSKVMNCNILRFTLQPIVENSLFHGLDVKRENGQLIITAIAIDDIYAIYIWDSGAGIPEQELIHINELLESSPEDYKNLYAEKNGMYNVNARIKFHYGNQYGLKIESTIGCNTTVKITLPANTTN